MLDPTEYDPNSRDSTDDASFEQNFFQLAFAYVRDKIPNLLDYMLDFEVVNKNDEGTQAIGLFKFDVSGRELFVPVFYKNGELNEMRLEIAQLRKQRDSARKRTIMTSLTSEEEETQ